MADNRYVSIDYVESGYDEVQNTAWYIESGYFELGYVIQGTTQSGEAAMNAASVVSATSARTKSGSVSATSTSTFTAQAVKVFGAGTSLTAVTTLTVIPLQIVAADLTIADSVTITASAMKIHGAGTTINSLATVSATSVRIQPAAADFTAFNTVVTAAGRIRPAADFSALNATLTATPTKVFGASTNTIEAYLATQFPVAGVHLTEDSYANGVGYLLYRDSTSFNQSQFFSSSTVIAFYARAESQTAGVIFSFSGDGINRIPWTFTMGGNGLTVSGSGSRTWTNLPTITDIHHYAIHFGGTNGTTLYVDGIIQTNYTGSVSAAEVGWYENYPVLYLGRSRTIVNFGLPGQPNNYQEVQSDWWEGDLAQVWIGRPTNGRGLASPQFVRITGYRFDTFESFGIYGNMQESQVTTVGTNMPNGAGTDDTLSQPNFYAEFNDWTPAGTMDQVYFASYPLQGNFTVVAAGFAITYGEASLQSAASLSALAGYLKQSTAVMSAEFSFTATPYDFVKASATMQSAFAFTADPDEISSGVNIVLAESSLSADADVIRGGVVVTTLFADIAVTATTNLLGYAVITAQATLSATPYDFTKASTVITATAELTGEGRLQERVRGNVQMQSAFSLSAEVLRIRTNSLQIAAQASVVTGIGNALRGGNISMTAFDTVLSAGKIIEFLTENTITVTEEQRLLQVALESTVLLVEMANGVNTVTAESTDTKVAEEQGILLAQYNTPN